MDLRSFKGWFFNSELSNFRVFKIGPKSSRKYPQTIPKSPPNHPKSVPKFSIFFDFFRFFVWPSGPTPNIGNIIPKHLSDMGHFRSIWGHLRLIFSILDLHFFDFSKPVRNWFENTPRPSQNHPQSIPNSSRFFRFFFDFFDFSNLLLLNWKDKQKGVIGL